MSNTRLTATAFFSLIVLSLAGCGGGGDDPPPTPHTIGGSVSGLQGGRLSLSNNGTDGVYPTANGAFTFSTPVPSGSAFNVAVVNQPSGPTQTCTVAHGSGTVTGNDITNVEVSCAINYYTVGGSVSGLLGSGFVVENGGGYDLSVGANGAFVFGGTAASGVSYSITVATQPANPAQTCVVANGTGNVGSVNVTTPSITCTTNTYSVNGYAAGLTGTGLALSYGGGTPVAVSRNGGFQLATSVAQGAAYNVTIASQPTNPAQTCVLTGGSGAVQSADVQAISVFCPQPVGRFAYVVGTGKATGTSPIPGSLSVYEIDPGTGALTLVPGSAVATGANVTSFQRIPHSSHAWALSLGNSQASVTAYAASTIHDYVIDSSTGLLTPSAGNPYFDLGGSGTTPGCRLSGGGSTRAVSFHPDGTFGYVSNTDMMGAFNASIWKFTVNPATGAPSLVAGSAVTAACVNPGIASVDPGGRFMYVGAQLGEPPAPAGLYAFTIDSTSGNLTQVPGSPYAVGSNGQVIDPASRRLYASTSIGILVLTIDPSTGALAPLTVITPTAAFLSMSIEPRGRFVYLVELDGIHIYSFDDSTGALTASGSVALQSASKLSFDPSGKFAYVVAATNGQKGVYGFAVDANTGGLTPVPGSPFASSTGLGSPLIVAVP